MVRWTWMPAHRSFSSNMRLAELSREQRGLLTRTQLSAERVSDSTLSRWVRAGTLIPVFRRVFRNPAVPESWEQRLLAACLSGGVTTLASHRSAGALWNLDECEPGPIEVLTTRRLRSSGMRCTRTAEIPTEDKKRVRGIPVTSSLPVPAQQWRVMDGTRVIGRFDFVYPDARLAIEIDGYRWHAGNEAWNRDRGRNNDLARLGWTILRFTANDLKDPGRVVAQIRDVLQPRLDVDLS